MNRQLAFVIIVLGTVLGLAGIDLVLPAIPTLPASISGTLSQSQLVLAAFTGGTAIGLLVFGELGARFRQKHLLIAALTAYSLLSVLSAMSDSINELVGWRIFQGFAAAAPAVFAPGMIRNLFDERRALRALGLLGSIESVVPALAPIFGAWLLTFADWRASFILTALLTLALAIAWLLLPDLNYRQQRVQSTRGYLSLIKSGVFMRYALSQAFTLGGLLIFVFGAPTVMTVVLGGTLSDFITMQVIGISLFIVAANTTHALVGRFGNETVIFFGSSLAAFGATALFIYSLLADSYAPAMIWFLFAFVNLGLGFRGPPGFYQAILAAQDNDARGAAMVILLVFFTTALGTALLAPFITLGLIPLAASACAVSCGSVMALLLLPELPPTLPQES